MLLLVPVMLVLLVLLLLSARLWLLLLSLRLWPHARRAMRRLAGQRLLLLLLAFRTPQLLLCLTLLAITLGGAGRVAKRLRGALGAARLLNRGPLLLPATRLGRAHLTLEALVRGLKLAVLSLELTPEGRL